MHHIYGRQDMPTLLRAQENCVLLTNGLGGYASLSAAFSMTRADQGFLVSARTAPNDRVTLVGRVQEVLELGSRESFLSTQQFADGTPPEEGYRHLSCLTVGDTPVWRYHVRGVCVTREAAMAHESNTTVLVYTIENRSQHPCTLRVRPHMLGFEKGHAPRERWEITLAGSCITSAGQRLYLHTDGTLTPEEPRFCAAAYLHDAPDGRPGWGLQGSICRVHITVAPGQTGRLTFVLSDRETTPPADDIIAARHARMQRLRDMSGLTDPTALQLVGAADAYIAHRASTCGKTILAGYPFFGDWGRDTMIALPGCCLATGRFDDAKSILRTFLAYEKDGLVPNLFPEGAQEPMYNTVDAALLLINVIYLYIRASGDTDFAREAWPVMKRIIAAYRRGTHHGIRMDADDLICAGEGLDQVTWMDVRIGDILPTPRHGKPVEINAYWYSALKVMQTLAEGLGMDAEDWGALAEQVRSAFVKAFWREDKGYLRDVISGTAADDQLRCNQIWAVTQPFTMLTPEQERRITDAVYAHLYTPCGLRTLSPDDAQYHGSYGGEQKVRDMAYHQGTSWVFPLGAYYLAWLKTHGNTPQAAAEVHQALAPMASALREGCIGQLPEIYDGDAPSCSRGCFAQAWSVGEMLRVYAALERLG